MAEVMPTTLVDAGYRERKTIPLDFACLEDWAFLPRELPAPHDGDKLSDDESDAADFDIKVPDLQELINEFEKDDDVIHKGNEAMKQHFEGLRLKALEAEPRVEIKDRRADAKVMLDENISERRKMQGARLVSAVEDLNEVVKSVENKIYMA